MAGLKEIRRRLTSVTNTKKITYAMKLVSAAKLKKAQEAVKDSREYTDAINKLLAQIAAETGSDDGEHPLMTAKPEVKNIKLVVIGGARGLCGPYNSNIYKSVVAFYKEHADKKIDAVIFGKKPAEFFRRNEITYSQSFEEELSEDPNLWPLDDVCHELEAGFIDGTFDEVYVIYTRFKSAISMTVMQDRLLPLDAEETKENVLEAQTGNPQATGITLFEPSAEEVFDSLIPRIMRAKVRQSSLDAKASEHGSRMTAMDAATSNAGDLIISLTRTRNRLRQEGITSELLDIIGGAEALG